MYRAKGFILRIDGENGMSVSRDDGSAAGAEPWKNGGIVQLVHGQSHMYIAIVVDTEDKPAVSDEPTQLSRNPERLKLKFPDSQEEQSFARSRGRNAKLQYEN
jgi:hypothetical protein